jgi:hypothetical protein
MKVIDNAVLPPELVIETVTDAINVLIAVYTGEQQNLPDGDTGYHVTQIDDKHYEILDDNPYLFSVNYGYIYGILRRFLKTPFTLTHEFLNQAQPEMGAVKFKVALH